MAKLIQINLEDFQRRVSKGLVPATVKDTERLEKKQNQIVEGACKVLFEKGFNPSSIREIAKACGMSMGQLYRCISSKDDILFLVHKHMHQSWCDHLEKAGFDNIDAPVQRLTQAIKLTLEYIVRNKKLIQFVYSESKYLGKEHLKLVLEMDDKNVVELWRKLLLDVKKDEYTDNECDLAANLIAFLMVFLSLRGWNVREQNLEKRIDFLTDFILQGLGVDSKERVAE